MLRWLKRFRQKHRRGDDETSPEATFVGALASQISIPQKAGPVLDAVDAFVRLDGAAQQAELPRVYLLLEQYLTDVDPVRTLTRAYLREFARTKYPEIVRHGPISLVFDPPSRQEVHLCRLFLTDVLDRAIHVLGGSSLSGVKAWIHYAPHPPPGPPPVDIAVEPPSSDPAWIAAFMEVARSLYEQLRVGLGEATADIYDAAYAALAHRYAGLETFPIVIRLLPDGLLDEERIQSLARHGTMSRVQGELSAAQRSALDSAKQLQAVLSTVGEGIVTVDENRLIVLVNREFERTFGYQRDELIGARLGTLISLGADRQAYVEHLGETIDAEGCRQDGSTFPVEICVNETIISDQLFYTAAVRDVTVQRNYERDLVRAKDHAEEMTRLKTAFLANMSHEIRTPLSGIMGAVQILDEEIEDEHKEFTRMVNDGALRLLSTLDSVLEFARLESGELASTCESVDLGPLLEQAANRFEGRALQKGLSFHAEAASFLVWADPGGLRRIIDVLLENAIRFTHQGGVVLSVHEEADHVRIVVRDDGIGISPSFLPHVFDEFRQESTGHARSHEGTGLGLAIARRHARAIGARLAVESAPGRGSTFTLSLSPANELRRTRHTEQRAIASRR